MTADAGQDGPLELAARRLERALAMLDQRLARRLEEAKAAAAGAFDQDRANLATELDASRGRERDLEEAASAAYDALAGAITEIRNALGEEGRRLMAQLTIEVNGRAYQVGCEDGQEDHLRHLASLVDTQVREVGLEVGQLGETRLMLMGALLMADLYTGLEGRIATLEAEAAKLKADAGRVELKAVAAIEHAAQKIEQIAAE